MKKKLDKERVIAAIGWGESKAEKFDRDTQVISVEYLKREIEKISDAEVGDEPKEPEKVVVPQFVADILESNKGDGLNYSQTVRRAEFYLLGDGFDAWYSKGSNAEVFARAWLDGYEVEEPQWVVKIGNSYFHSFFDNGIEQDIGFASFRKSIKLAAFHFSDKEKAEAVALLIGGQSEELTD